MAKKRKFPLYFYTVHDMDLISLDGDDFNLVQAVYLSLKGFCNGQSFLIEAPPGKSAKQFKKRKLQLALWLDPETDADAIAFLNHITPGARNNFLKNLTRQYLCRPAAEGFLPSGEAEDYYNSRLAALREGRRTVKMRNVPRRKWRRRKTESSPLPEKKKKKNRYAASWDEVNSGLSGPSLLEGDKKALPKEENGPLPENKKTDMEKDRIVEKAEKESTKDNDDDKSLSKESPQGAPIPDMLIEPGEDVKAQGDEDSLTDLFMNFLI